MVPIKKFFFHFILVIVILIDSIDRTIASKQCKSTVMTVIMKQCSNTGTRDKRNAEQVAQEIEGEIGERKNVEHSIARRQLISNTGAAVANLAGPIMATAITSALNSRSYSPQIGGRFAAPPFSYPSPIITPYHAVSPYFVPAYSQPISYQPESRLSTGFLPQAAGDDLGFDLSVDEIEEIYNEVFDRIARSSTKTLEELRMKFIEIAAKCCQNEVICLKDKNIISCV